MVRGQWLKLIVVFVFLSRVLFAQTEALMEAGSFRSQHGTLSSEIKIVSYNIRWRGGNDLKKLIEVFKHDKEIGGAQILGLQEVDRNRKRTGNQNTVKTIAHSLNMHYAWAAPPNPKGKEREEEETGVAILSAFPMSDVTRFVLPVEGPGGRRRAAIGATVHIGELKIRVYSVHAETRINADKKAEQLKVPIKDLNENHEDVNRAIVLGDFNTILDQVDNTSLLFLNSGFNTPFPTSDTTWKQYFIKLKLDWMWLRGMEAKEYGIDKKITFSDHYPLWINVSLPHDVIGGKTKLNHALRKELVEMRRADQKIREDFKGENVNSKEFMERMIKLDTDNTVRLKEILKASGWPGADVVGRDGVEAAFLIVQHSPDHRFQEEMLPFIETAAKRGELSLQDYALLTDRTRVHAGKPQLYGTHSSVKDSKLVIDPIEDEKNVDERRRAIGLPAMSEYIELLKDMYKLPVEKPQKTDR